MLARFVGIPPWRFVVTLKRGHEMKWQRAYYHEIRAVCERTNVRFSSVLFLYHSYDTLHTNINSCFTLPKIYSTAAVSLETNKELEKSIFNGEREKKFKSSPLTYLQLIPKLRPTRLTSIVRWTEEEFALIIFTAHDPTSTFVRVSRICTQGTEMCQGTPGWEPKRVKKQDVWYWNVSRTVSVIKLEVVYENVD